MKKNCISCCLYGNKKKYFEIGKNLLKFIKTFLPDDFDIVLYTDDTKNEHLLDIEPFVDDIVDMSGFPELQGDLKACYRFHALDFYNTVVLLDLDFKEDMYNKVKNLILIAEKYQNNLPNHILTYNAEHLHENFKPIPAGLTIIYHDGNYESIFHEVLLYISKEPKLTYGSSRFQQNRYANGYGMDEKFLTFHLKNCIKDLKIIRNVFNL